MKEKNSFCFFLVLNLKKTILVSGTKSSTTKYLVDFIQSKNVKVNYPSHKLDTAFDVTFGDSGPLVVLCVEYDALPEIGHACGHNIIATASIGAGLGLQDVANDLGIRVKLLGTPAEEGGGGKIIDRKSVV